MGKQSSPKQTFSPAMSSVVNGTEWLLGYQICKFHYHSIEGYFLSLQSFIAICMADFLPMLGNRLILMNMWFAALPK